MKRKFDRNNIKKMYFHLYKVNAEKIDKEPNGEGVYIHRSDKYEILDLNDYTFSLKIISKVFIEPEALFCINLEYKANFELSHKVDEAFIKKNANELLNPIGSEMSYIISTLTKAITDSYFIMPPMISID